MVTTNNMNPAHRNISLAARLVDLGPMRLALMAMAILLIIMVPAPGTRAIYQGFAAVQTLVVPALVPIILMVLLLDALMSAVFMIDKQGDERRRLRLALTLHLALVVLMIVVWYPYFRAIATGT